MKTWNPKASDESTAKWWLADANGKNVGRIATEIAKVLRGKHKPTFTPNVDMGDFVVVINSKNVEFTGRKWENKKYYQRSRYFGSLKEATAAQLREKNPNSIVLSAVQGMLPKSKLGRRLINKLKVYEGGEHPHFAQKPEALNI